MERYGMYQFQDATTFVVRNQTIIFEPIVNGQGDKATVTNPADLPYFNLTHDEALALKSKLNAR